MCDSHIHLALKPLSENWRRDIQDFLDTGGKKILTQGTDILDFSETFELAEKINNEFNKDIVDIAIGIHPTVFHEKFFKEDINGLREGSKKFLNRFKEAFEKEKKNLVAIGETGLDYFEMNNLGLDEKRIEALKEIQKESFKIHTILAKENNLAMSIHARELEGSNDCVTDALKILAKYGNGISKGVFHSYTGEVSNVTDILDMGFYIGFNAIITYPSGENVRNILKETPTERIVFETDGPFLATQSVRRKKKAPIKYGRSQQIKEIIEVAAEIKNISAKRLEEISDENYNTLFN